MSKVTLQDINDALVDYLPYEIGDEEIITFLKKIIFSASQKGISYPFRNNPEAQVNRWQLTKMMSEYISDKRKDLSSTIDVMDYFVNAAMKNKNNRRIYFKTLLFISDYYKRFGASPDFEFKEHFRNYMNGKIRKYYYDILTQPNKVDLPLVHGEANASEKILQRVVPTFSSWNIISIIPHDESVTNPIYALLNTKYKDIDEKLVMPVFKNYHSFLSEANNTDFLIHFNSEVDRFPIKEELKTLLKKKLLKIVRILNGVQKRYEEDSLKLNFDNFVTLSDEIYQTYGKGVQRKEVSRRMHRDVSKKWQEIRNNNSELVKFVQDDFKKYASDEIDISAYCRSFNERNNIDLSCFNIANNRDFKMTPALLCGLVPEVYYFDPVCLYFENYCDDKTKFDKLRKFFSATYNIYNDIEDKNWVKVSKTDKREKNREIAIHKQKLNRIVEEVLMTGKKIFEYDIELSGSDCSYLKKRLVNLGRNYEEEEKLYSLEKRFNDLVKRDDSLKSFKELETKDLEKFANFLSVFEKAIDYSGNDTYNYLTTLLEDVKEKVNDSSFNLLDYYLNTDLPIEVLKEFNTFCGKKDKKLNEYFYLLPRENYISPSAYNGLVMDDIKIDEIHVAIADKYILDSELPSVPSVINEVFRRINNGTLKDEKSHDKCIKYNKNK